MWCWPCGGPIGQFEYLHCSKGHSNFNQPVSSPHSLHLQVYNCNHILSQSVCLYVCVILYSRIYLMYSNNTPGWTHILTNNTPGYIRYVTRFIFYIICSSRLLCMYVFGLFFLLFGLKCNLACQIKWRDCQSSI